MGRVGCNNDSNDAIPIQDDDFKDIVAGSPVRLASNRSSRDCTALLLMFARKGDYC
jgi:hypothetical protein